MPFKIKVCNYSCQADIDLLMHWSLHIIYLFHLFIYSILATFLGEYQHIGMDSIASYSDEELCGRCADDGEVKSSLPKTF